MTAKLFETMSQESIQAAMPEIVELADSVEVIDDLYEQPTVGTGAGETGLLLQGESAQAHLIKQPPWLYVTCDHPTESIIVTLEGEWVLNSHGERRRMTPGSIFWFGSGIPAGFEVPFSEPSTILIFKSEKPDESPAEFVKYLIEQSENDPQTLHDLPADHPAVEYAESINEQFRHGEAPETT